MGLVPIRTTGKQVGSTLWMVSQGNSLWLHNERHPITLQIEFVQTPGSVFQEIAFPISSQVENVVPLPLVVNGEAFPAKVLIKQ
jgi:hypothetical protein